VVFLSLGAVVCLIWFSLRLSRKFRFDSREDSSSSGDVGGDDGGDDDAEDDKGGDDGEVSDMAKKATIALLVIPTIAVVVSIMLVLFAGESTHEAESGACGSVSAHADFVNITDKISGKQLIDGRIRFTHFKPSDPTAAPPNVEVAVKYTHTDTPDSPYDFFEVFEYPVGVDGDCSKLGNPYPTNSKEIKFAPQLKVTNAAGKKPPYLTEMSITNDPKYDSTTKQNKYTLFGAASIAGRSVKACTTVACNAKESPPPQCANIVRTGVKSTILSSAFNASNSDVKGSIRFEQVTAVRDESDTTIFWELESTSSSTEIKDLKLTISTVPVEKENDGSYTKSACAAVGYAPRGVMNSTFDINGGMVNDAKCAKSGATYTERLEFCKSGDLTAKYGSVIVGAKGQPSRGFVVDKFWRETDPISKTSAKQGGILLRTHSSGVAGIGDGKHTVVLSKKDGTVLSCAPLPVWTEFKNGQVSNKFGR